MQAEDPLRWPGLGALAVAGLLIVGDARAGCSQSSVGARLERRAWLPGGTDLLPPAGLPGLAPQWLQGISAVAALGPERFLALLDNGNGAPENSRGCLLALVEFRIEGPRAIPERTIYLSDPDRHLPFILVRGQDPGRPLTGADLDPEALVRLPDGSLWIGDEFGPFLLHFDADGRLLEPALELALPVGGTEAPAGGAGRALALGAGAAQLPSEAALEAPGFAAQPGAAGLLHLRSPQHPAFGPATLLRCLSSLDLWVRQSGGGPVALSPSKELLLAAARPADRLGLESLQRAGFAVIPWTVNSPAEVDALLAMGVDGLIGDDPGLLLERCAALGEGRALAGPAARPRAGALGFDVQGHRGARARRPENSLPAFELALELGATTLELDCQLTADGRLLVAHDPLLPAGALRFCDPHPPRAPLPIQELALAEVRALVRADGLDADFGEATRDPSAAPLSAAFAASRGWESPFTPLELPDLFQFVVFSARHFELGPGRDHPQASVRASRAARVRFNIELKTSPERQVREQDLEPWIAALERALDCAPAPFERRARICVQSFDLRLLRRLRSLEVSWLIAAETLRPEPAPGERRSAGFGPVPWMAGEPAALAVPDWSAAPLAAELPAAVRPSGGFEGLCRDPFTGELLALLEKPLAGAGPRELLLFGLDPGTSPADGPRAALAARVWRYPLSERATAVGDLQWLGPGRLLALERDDSQGDLAGWKRLYELRLGPPGTLIEKLERADLLDLALPEGWARDSAFREGLFAGQQPGDLGLPGDPEGLPSSVEPQGRFALPFVTLETALPLEDGRLLIVNDNNFPHSVGRHVGSGRPDDTEWVWLRLDP